MAQITSGIRRSLSHPAIYNVVQALLGAEKARRILVRDLFAPNPGDRMLDIGCGTAEILKHLPHDIHYHGFDASHDYIQQAIRKFGHRGNFHAKLVEQTTVSDLEPFDLILAFGLLHHLDDSEALALFSLARGALAPDGKLVTIDPSYVERQHPLARWVISKDRGQNIRTPAQYETLARYHFDQVTVSVRNNMLHIPYTHALLECRIDS